MSSANVTRQALSFGARDSVTNWLSKTYTDSTIKGSFDPANVQGLSLHGVNFPYYTTPFYTGNYVKLGDRIKNSAGSIYELTAVKDVWYLDQFIGYFCNVTKLVKPATRPATSGTWHVDGDGLNTDPRYRTKAWLDNYISYTGSSVLVFGGVDYPIIYELNDYDLVASIIHTGALPEYDAYNKPYMFNETVELHCAAIDTASATATTILETYEEAVRKVASDYPTASGLGSIREITATKPQFTTASGMPLWQNVITINYQRSNSDYTPTYPTITYGDNQATTFTFPNVTDISYNDPDSGDAYLLPPGRIGEITQILGMENFEVTLTCNLDINSTGLTWKRPQTTTPKTDVMPEQVFREIKFMGKTDSDQTYQNLNLGFGAVIPVRVTDIDLEKSGAGCVLRVTFKRYSATDGSAGTYNAWYGIST